ncbi:hypothetical protein [Arthrobacter sp.]|uniref:hypothetical protein n=1 Tax=Arthrobacter sp. TaxID=1667 RepID=UPI003A95C58F
MSANDEAEATYGRGQDASAGMAEKIAEVLAAHQQLVYRAPGEFLCPCGAYTDGTIDAHVAHQAEELATTLADLDRRAIAEEVVRINQEIMLIRNRRAIDEEIARGPLQFERRKFDGEDAR